MLPFHGVTRPRMLESNPAAAGAGGDWHVRVGRGSPERPADTRRVALEGRFGWTTRETLQTPGRRARGRTVWRRQLSTTAGGPEGTATQSAGSRLGFKSGMVVQELGWDEDVDDDLRMAIEDAIDADLVDGDYGNVVDSVLLWWRDDDGDLVDALVEIGRAHV